MRFSRGSLLATSPPPAPPPPSATRLIPPPQMKEVPLLGEKKESRTQKFLPLVVNNKLSPDVYPSCLIPMLLVARRCTLCAQDGRYDLYFHVLMLFTASSSPLGAHDASVQSTLSHSLQLCVRQVPNYFDLPVMQTPKQQELGKHINGPKTGLVCFVEQMGSPITIYRHSV